MRGVHFRVVLATCLLLTALLSLPPAAPAGAADHVPAASSFPNPPTLRANVEFWRQIYSEFGVGDFVLHDRDNLEVIYGVVRVRESRNAARAAAAAKPEIDRLRSQYETVFARLADGTPPEELGDAGQRVARLWGCPCAPDVLLRAASNIRVQQGLRERVEEGLRRARTLLPRMLAILHQHGVPPELSALPLVESSFNPAARSKAGAVGLWQFLRSTGRRYLTITRRRDDRRNPLKATEAAAHLLRHNYETLGSWPLAILAYNHGTQGVCTARQAVGSDAIEDIIAGYSGPRFGFASKNFYAEFLAALELVQPLILQQAPPGRLAQHSRSRPES